jgi:hypothetical protein
MPEFSENQIGNSGYPQNYLGSVIQSPKINASGKPTQKSIKDVSMARDVVKTVIMAGRNRSIVNSRILAKYNAERPYDAYKLEAEGLGWRSNFTTKPLPSMIEKAAPRFTVAVDGLKYFTNSHLSNKWTNNVEKTETFRDEITKCIRKRPGFRTLIEDIAFNNTLFGHNIVAWLDEFSWFPKNFQQDESFVADGTKADTRWAQIVVLKEVYLPHELFECIKDKEAAEEAGWDIKNTIEAINTASPIQIRDRLNVGGTLETWYQNALRELTIGASYMAGASVVVCYSLLAREVTGKVSHYRMAGPGMFEVFHRDDRFDGMSDCLSFFSFQKGNGTLHGSKGIGRDIYELAGMLDRTRNEIVDRLIMSGKTMVQGDVRRIHTFKMSVIGNTVIIPTGWDVLEHKIDGNVEGFVQLDSFFSQLVDELIGSTSAPKTDAGGEAMRSPAAWNVVTQRQEEGQDNKITRFLSQFVCMIQTMQKRICDADTVDDDAKEVQKCLLQTMTREEIDELASCPVAETVRDLTPLQRQLLVSVVQEKKGNPLYNQRALEVEDLTARVNTEFADRVLLPDNDPTQTAEQDRQQQLEIVLLSQGQPVPVSPRDNHLIHLQILMPAAQQVAQQMMQGQLSTDTMEAMLGHINEHYTQAQSQGSKPEQLAPYKDFIKKIGPALAQLKQIDAQAAQVNQAHDTLMAGGQPQPQGAPPGAPQPPKIGPRTTRKIGRSFSTLRPANVCFPGF